MFGKTAEAYPLCAGVGHGLHEPVELVAHGFGSNSSGSTFEMLHVQNFMAGRMTTRSVRTRGKVTCDADHVGHTSGAR